MNKRKNQDKYKVESVYLCMFLCVYIYSIYISFEYKSMGKQWKQ